MFKIRLNSLVTPSHVVLRFELEKALFEGSVKVEDLPAVWNQ